MATPTSAPPSRNPTTDNRLLGVFNVVLRKFLQQVDDMLPAQVVAYDRATNMASVQPLINIVTTLNTQQTRAQIASVPVLQMGGGGFVLNFPIKTGDLGWIKANDRDISLFKQFWRAVVPATGRFHSFSDSVFIPSVLTGFTIAAADNADHVVLQSLSGALRLALGTGACISDQVGYSQSNNAILDLQSTTKAFKVPRMTRAQRNAIPSPVGGFMVYVTDSPAGFSFYTDGSGWS